MPVGADRWAQTAGVRETHHKMSSARSAHLPRAAGQGDWGRLAWRHVPYRHLCHLQYHQPDILDVMTAVDRRDEMPELYRTPGTNCAAKVLLALDLRSMAAS